MDISETLFQAVGILIDKKIESVKFDETIEATIVDATKAEAGEYQVSTGNAKFTAYSTESQYRVNDIVLVTIPQGDYDNQKIIISKKVDKNNTPMIYKSPFQQLVDISTNLISNTAELEVGMWANGEAEAWKEDELNPGGDPIWSREFNGENQNSPPLQGYTRIGLQGQFSTYLADFDTIKGNYGLALKITFSAPLVKDSANAWDKWVYLDSDNFLGDPYNFETYYTQENVFDIEEYKDYPITKLELYAYQRCNFYDADGNKVPANDDEDFSSIPPNIFIKDPYICVGIPVDSFDQDTAEIYSDNGLNYTKDYDEKNNAVSRFDNNAKTIQLRWVHKDEEKDIIKTMQYDDAFDDKYEIRWYVYQLGAQSPDQFAGAHWVRLYGLRAAADETGSYVISEPLESTEEIEYNENHIYELLDKKGILVASYFDSSILQIPFYPNVNHQEEKIKVIIVKREIDLYGDAIYTFVSSSNELVLTNNTLVRNQATVIDMNALSIRYVTAQGAMDDTLGKFFVYNRADKVSKNEYLVAHYLEAAFDPDQPDVYQKDPLELGNGDSITWIFPSDSTMIIPGEQTDNGPIHSDKFTQSGVTSIPYFIKDYLNRTASNNTVICKVLKDGLEYVAEAQMLFGTAGISGSDYTLTLTWRDGKNALDVTNLNPDFVDSLVGQVELYDSAGRPVLDTVDNYELTYDWYVADQINTEFGLSDYELETKHLFYPVGNDDQVLYTPQTEQEHAETIDDRAKFYLPAGDDSSDLYDFSFNENKFIGNSSNGIYRQRKDGEEKFKFSFTNIQVINDSSSSEVWVQEVNNTNNIAEHILDESQPSVTDIISAIKTFFLVEDENGNMNEDVLTTSPTQQLYDDVLTDYFTLYNELAAKNLNPEDDQNDLQEVYISLYGRPTQSAQNLFDQYGIDYQVVIDLFTTITNIYNSFNEDITKDKLLTALENTMVNKTSSMVYKIYDNSVFRQLADIFYNNEGNATLTSIVNGWKILQRSKNYIYLTNSSSETITLSQPAFNYYNGNGSTRKRAFIERNGYFILDPFDEYSPTEIYYAVHLNEPLQLTNSPLIIADKPEGEPQKIVTIKPRYNLNNLPVSIENNTLQNWYMNSLSILRVTLSNFGDYNLVALYPIPIKNNTVKTAEGQITYEARFIEGPTQVRYSTMGETEYDRNPYSIHINKFNDGEIINYDSDKNLPNTILPSVSYHWSICRRNKFSNFVPKLVETNPNLTNEEKQEMIGYGQSTLPILQPPVIYIPTEYAYGVTFYDNEIPVWTQPILVYEDRYPSTTLNQWNGSDISTDNETGTIVASAFAAGKKESDNTFTGVMLGDWSRTDTDKAITKQTGVFGFNHGAMSYALKDDGTAFFGKDGSGRIYFDGNSSTIYSSQWKGNNKLGMLLDVDDGYIELRGTSGTFETQQNIVIEDPNSVDDTYLVVPVQDASIYGAPFVKISSKETRYPIQVGLNNEAYFSVQWDGSISVTRGTISGACISSSLISGTNIFANYLQSSRGNIGGWQINHSSLSSPKTSQLGSDGYAAKTVLSPINGITTNRIKITEDVTIPNSDNGNSEPTIGTITGTLGLIYGYDGASETTAFGMKTSDKLIIEGGSDQVNRISGGEIIIGDADISRIVIRGSENDNVPGSKIYIGKAGQSSIIIDSQAYSTEINGNSLKVNVPAAAQTGIYARFA